MSSVTYYSLPIALPLIVHASSRFVALRAWIKLPLIITPSPPPTTHNRTNQLHTTPRPSLGPYSPRFITNPSRLLYRPQPLFLRLLRFRWVLFNYSAFPSLPVPICTNPARAPFDQGSFGFCSRSGGLSSPPFFAFPLSAILSFFVRA